MSQVQKIVTIVGARPQFIKCAPVSRVLRNDFHEILVHTGQHYDSNMSDVFFNELEIPSPDYNLGIGSAPHGEQTGKMLIEIERILIKEKPSLVLLYGDTNSTLAGSLAAIKLQIKVAHIEAGLRSFDKTMPEEVNRIVTDHASSLLFCPTKFSEVNLNNEGIKTGVYIVGDVMLDALLYYANMEKQQETLSELNLISKNYYLVTLHRPQNTDIEDNIRNIVEALNQLDKTVVFPVHPRTKKVLEDYGLLKCLDEHIKLIEPLGYLNMITLIKDSSAVLTDSGGVQKEAFLLSVPCITLRENTEWIETIEDGWNVLVGAQKNRILDAARDIRLPKKRNNVFGKGDASEKIVSILKEELYRKDYL